MTSLCFVRQSILSAVWVPENIASSDTRSLEQVSSCLDEKDGTCEQSKVSECKDSESEDSESKASEAKASESQVSLHAAAAWRALGRHPALHVAARAHDGSDGRSRELVRGGHPHAEDRRGLVQRVHAGAP